MIQTKELMLGNWVYESERSKFPMKVVSIDTNTVYLDFEGNEGDVFDGKESDIYPIPLTKEILLKNKFKKGEYYQNINSYRYVYNEDSRFFDVLIFGTKDSYIIEACNFRLKYVHQLQCLLNFCGIEIDFKI